MGPLSRAPELVEATYTCSSTRNVHKHGISQSLVKGGDPFGCSCSWRISRKYGRLLPRASCCPHLPVPWPDSLFLSVIDYFTLQSL